jgi:hypothetical protein
MVVRQDVTTVSIDNNAGTCAANLAAAPKTIASHLRDLDVNDSGRRRFNQWRQAGNGLAANAGGQCGLRAQ